MGGRRAVAAFGVGLMSLVGVASLAWACTATTFVSATPLNPDGTPAPSRDGTAAATATPGSFVRVNVANGFSGPTEVRWNSVNGPLLANGSSSFSARAQVPAEASPGVYYLVVVARNGSGEVLGKASTTLAVASPSGPANVVPNPWQPSAPTSSTGGSDLGLMVGAGLLSAGLVALFSGFTVAQVRRRRRAAASTGHDS